LRDIQSDDVAALLFQHMSLLSCEHIEGVDPTTNYQNEVHV
jgi:hypothetical protein